LKSPPNSTARSHGHSQRTVLNAEDKFAQARSLKSAPQNISQLSLHAQHLLNKKDLEVSKIRPFFWSMVETYVDRFQQFPFDVNRALFSYLEDREFPEHEVRALIEQIKVQFEKHHGKPLFKPEEMAGHEGLDDEIRRLRDTLKYAAVVSEPVAGDEDRDEDRDED